MTHQSIQNFVVKFKYKAFRVISRVNFILVDPYEQKMCPKNKKIIIEINLIVPKKEVS